MANKSKGRTLIPSEGSMFADVALRLKLVGRLMLDSRVSPLLKLLPIGSLVYLLAPDLLPGPIDDAAIIWGGLYFFIELAPAHVVEEHVKELTSTVQGDWEVVDEEPTDQAQPHEDGNTTDVSSNE